MSSKSGYKLVLTPGHAMKEVLMMTQRKQLAFAAEHREIPLSESRELARAALIEQGVSQPKAAELARKLEPLAMLDRIEYVAFQIQSDNKNSFNNPAGYLISFVEGEQQIPPSFQTKRQMQANEKCHLEQERVREVENDRLLARMQLQQEYDKWSSAQADEVIAHQFEGELLSKQLKEISNQLRKDERMAAMLDRMQPQFRRTELMPGECQVLRLSQV